MMELLLHTLSQAQNNPRRRPTGPTGAGKNVQLIVQIYKRCAPDHSPSTSLEEGRIMDSATTKVRRRSLRLKQITPEQQPSPDPPLDRPVVHALVAPNRRADPELAIVSTVPGPDETSASDSSNKEVQDPPEAPQEGKKRKASRSRNCKRVVRAIENASLTIAASIDRIHTPQIVEGKANPLVVLWHKDMMKRDRLLKRNHKDLMTAITGLNDSINRLTETMKREDFKAK